MNPDDITYEAVQRAIADQKRNEKAAALIQSTLTQYNPDGFSAHVLHCYRAVALNLFDGLPAATTPEALAELVFWMCQVDMLGHSQITREMSLQIAQDLFTPLREVMEA